MTVLRCFLAIAVCGLLLGCDDDDGSGSSDRRSKHGSSSVGGSSPMDVYKLSAQYSREGKMDALYDLHDSETHRLYDQMGERVGLSGREMFRRQIGPMIRKIQSMRNAQANADADVREQINGDHAVIKTTINSQFGGFNTDVELIRENGEWKLRLPKIYRDSMAQMESIRKQIEQRNLNQNPQPKFEGIVNEIPIEGLIPNGQWRIVYFSSESTYNKCFAKNAIDGDPKTFWYSQKRPRRAKHPHVLVIDLGREYTVRGFRYLTRQDNRWTGTIKSCQFYVSNEPKKFDEPVVTATFKRTLESQEVTFLPKKGRYVGIRTQSEISGNDYVAIAELGVVGE